MYRIKTIALVLIFLVFFPLYSLEHSRLASNDERQNTANNQKIVTDSEQMEMFYQVHEVLSFFTFLKHTNVVPSDVIDSPTFAEASTSHDKSIQKVSLGEQAEMLYQTHEMFYFFSCLQCANVANAVAGVDISSDDSDIAQLAPRLENPEVEFSKHETESFAPPPPQEEEAREEFSQPERVKKASTPSEGILFDTGLVSFDMFYKYKREKDYDRSKAVMLKLLERDPDNFVANIEMAYLLLRVNEYAESLPYLKKAYTLSDEDPEIALQIAYTYDKIKDTDTAIEYYTIAAEGNDPYISEKAQAELDAKRGTAGTDTTADADKEKKCEGIFDRQFLEFYADTVYYNRFTNWVFSIDMKLGVSIDKCDRHQVYAWLWQVKDTKSAGGTTPAIFSDNVSIVSIGYRYRLLKDKYAFVYANFGEAYDLVYRNRSISRGDFRAGLYFYDSWDNPFRLPGLPRRSSLCRVGDIDFNFTYYSRYRYWIGYASWREGLKLYDTKCTAMNLYLRQFLAFDTVGEFFNNVYELGPVVEIHPYKPFPIKFLGGWVQGYYYKNRCDANPYGPRYTDLRFQAIIWTFF